MHDVDGTQMEYGSGPFEYEQVPDFGSGEYEQTGGPGSVLGSLFGEAEAEGNLEGGGYLSDQGLPLPEAMEDEMAAELLDVHNEDELEHFLGSLFHKVASTVGKVIKSPVGHALGGILKQVAKKALPIAGGALGTFIGGPAGGMLGSKLASMAGNAFGLELEGLSPEDRDFEVAKRYVRFASHAARRAALSTPHGHPVHVAKSAVVDAARKFAPGLLSPVASAPLAGLMQPSTLATPAHHARYRRQGKWIRRGRHIVLLGV